MFRSLDEARSDLMMASILTFAILGIFGDFLFRAVWNFFSKVKLWFRQRRIIKLVRYIGCDDKLDYHWPNGEDINLDRITAGYGQSTVIKDLSMTIPAGSTMAIVGPSGCGKTTLIRAIGHFVDETFRVNDGVSIGGVKVLSPGPFVGMVMQDAPVFEHLTVWDNVMFGNRVTSEEGRKANHFVLSLLREFGIESYATQPAAALSGGQRQRVALATAIANKPKLLLLDEPFGALDAITRRQLQKFYATNVHKNISAVFVTHDVEEALLIGDYVRIGIAKNTVTIDIDKGDMLPHDWEMQSGFYEYRKRILTSLDNFSL